MKQIRASWQPLSTLVLVLLVLPGCNALNPLCRSARPAPILTSLSPASVTFAQIQQGQVLTLTGDRFVVSSVVVINGTTLATTITSAQQLQATIPITLISGPGTASVTVHTPSGNTGDVGCTSGGTSHAAVLTIT